MNVIITNGTITFSIQHPFYVQAALVICGLFICNFAYMRSRNGLFSGTYPLIYSNPWYFYIQIRYMRVYFWSPYLSHITRSNCIVNECSLWILFNNCCVFQMFGDTTLSHLVISQYHNFTYYIKYCV